ncbi:MAG: 30S ribosomal protein S4e [Nitrososphaerales archaeon]
MGHMGGQRRTKRHAAPAYWPIPRKTHQFTITTSPGPHPKEWSYPLAVLIRDVLKLVKTYREAKASIKEGNFLIDGVVRKSPNFPVGLMDVLDIPILNKVFRLIPTPKNPLMPIEIPESEKNLKLCKVKNKTTVKGGAIQYGFHDGRTIKMESDIGLKPSDSCLIEIPSQKIIKSFKMEPDALILVTHGKMVGLIGKVLEIKPGTITRPRMATIDFNGTNKELPIDTIFVIGKGEPALTLQRG